jgi:hypothetical protein
MKKTFLSILLILNFQISFSADSLIVDTNKIWSIMTEIYGVMSTDQYTELYKIGNDTLINNTHYNKIFRCNDTLNLSWQLFPEFIRQDTNKVYIRTNESTERLIYDFNLSIGDTISQENFQIDETNWILTEIDTVYLYGYWRKQWTFKNMDYGPSGPEDIWIEGIGSTYGFNTPGNFMLEVFTLLLCVKQGETYIYRNPYLNSCYIYYSDLKVEEYINDFQILPNPCKDYITIKTDNNNFNYTIITLLGQTITSGSLYRDSKLDISELRKGIYIIRFKTDNYYFNRTLLKE